MYDGRLAGSMGFRAVAETGNKMGGRFGSEELRTGAKDECTWDPSVESVLGESCSQLDNVTGCCGALPVLKAAKDADGAVRCG
jgi:hypothetical protein